MLPRIVVDSRRTCNVSDISPERDTSVVAASRAHVLQIRQELERCTFSSPVRREKGKRPTMLTSYRDTSAGAYPLRKPPTSTG